MKLNSQEIHALEEYPIFLATSSGDKPNVTITESGVITNGKLLICDCGMTLAKENILKNPRVSFVSFRKFDRDVYECYKGFGKAKYYTNGEYLKLAQKRLKGEPFKPKGAVVITIEELFKVE